VPSSSLVGRDAEIAQVEVLLAGARGGHSGVLVLRGEAGVGKSALLADVADRATDFTVLRGVGIESESELAYAALHQILRPAFDRIDALPEPQAAALRAAFALTGETVDEKFRVSLGVLGLLSEVAEDRPLLVLVDDAQWLDQASVDALVFVARRLDAEALVLLFATREDELSALVAPGLPELRLTPLGPADSRTLLAERLATAVAEGALDWLVTSSRGNPLALLELPATLNSRQLAGQEPLTRMLPAATSVERAYLSRIHELPAETQTLLVVAAAEDSGHRSTVERAANALGMQIADLAPAESGGLLRVDRDSVVFRHPLVRTAIYRDAPFTERERAHRSLADAAAREGSPDRAAWHRAAATIGQDEAVAAELESTAERARARSGHAAASAALERASELSADPVAGARRLVAAAGQAWRAGQAARATTLVDRARLVVEDEALRAETDNLRGVIGWRCGAVPMAAESLLQGAERVAQTDPGKALETLADAGVAAWDAGEFGLMARIGEAAQMIPRLDDSRLSDLRDVLLGSIRLSLNLRVSDLPALADTVRRAVDSDDQRVLVWAAIAAEIMGDTVSEAPLLVRSVALARGSGAVDQLTVALESSTIQGFLSGNFEAAGQATEGLTLARQAGLSNAANLHLATLSWLSAVKGHEDECRAQAAEVVAAARPNGHGIAYAIAEWAVALCDLIGGRPEETVTRLRALAALSPGLGHPYYLLTSAADLVEAATRTDHRLEAESAFVVIDEFAHTSGAVWAQALAARSRGLLSDDEESAEKEFEAALQLHGDSGNPFETARTHLLLGEHLRRQRQRSAPREHLKAALTAFEQLGAKPWADRAAGELRATGETVKRDGLSAVDQLTPQELQIVRQVCQGSSNRDVAAQLFISPRTVEYHLYKAYPKLGIASRGELIRLFAQDLQPSTAS
jgi:ATP/maltotriose-dependent transcriptional regulator MalT